jgi:hypothetical protein
MFPADARLRKITPTEDSSRASWRRTLTDG